MRIKKLWLCVCLAWGMLGGSILYFAAHSLIGPALWFLAALLIGCLDELFVWQLVDYIPDPGMKSFKHPVVFVPIVGLVHGTLIGPLAGAVMAWACGGKAWQGALLGAVLGPLLVPLLALVAVSLPPGPKRGTPGPGQVGPMPLPWSFMARLT